MHDSRNRQLCRLEDFDRFECADTLVTYIHRTEMDISNEPVALQVILIYLYMLLHLFEAYKSRGLRLDSRLTVSRKWLHRGFVPRDNGKRATAQ